MTIVYAMTPGHPLPSVAWMVTVVEPSVVRRPRDQAARREREARRQRAAQHREGVAAGPAARRELLAVGHPHVAGGQRRRADRNYRARRRGNHDRIRDGAGTPVSVARLDRDRGGSGQWSASPETSPPGVSVRPAGNAPLDTEKV